MKTYRVFGLFSIGQYEYDSGIVFLPLDEAQRFFSLPARVNRIEVDGSDPDRADQIRDQLRELSQIDTVWSWQQVNGSFYEAIQIQRNVMFVILTLMILVAAFNIISGQIMLVRDKARGIAVLRTLGASRGTVIRVFLISGAFIGILGTLLGGVLGVLFARNIESIRQFVQLIIGQELFSAEIYYLTRLPAIIDPKEVASVIILALSLSILSAVYPAFRAGRVDPVEVLRYE